MLRLLEKQKQKMQTATELDKIQAKDKNATQSTRQLEESNQQKPYKKIHTNAIDMLQLLSKQQITVQTTIDPGTNDANKRNTTQSTREPNGNTQQKGYTKIKITLKNKMTPVCRSARKENPEKKEDCR